MICGFEVNFRKNVCWSANCWQTQTTSILIPQLSATLNLLNKGHSFQRTSLKFQRFFCCLLFLSLRYCKNLTSCPLFFNMICGLSITHSHTSKITKWPHILVIPLVGSPKPRTKSKNSPTHPGTEKRKAKVVILGDFRGGVRILFHRFQTWAWGYEEI